MLYEVITDVHVGAEALFDGLDEGQGAVGGQQGFAPAHAGAAEAEALQVGDVVGRGAEVDGVGGRQADVVLRGGAVEAVAVAAAVDEQAGPAPLGAQTASRITSYNVCYTKLLHGSRKAARNTQGRSRVVAGLVDQGVIMTVSRNNFV